jgi:hypothetical protein
MSEMESFNGIISFASPLAKDGEDWISQLLPWPLDIKDWANLFDLVEQQQQPQY